MPVAETQGSAPINRFVLLYALAWTGGAIAYTPLLTLLLPVRVAALAGPLASVDWLARIALVGAIAASLGGIGFGYLSDVTRNRRGWMAAGLVLSSLLLVTIGQVDSLAGLIAMIVCWQLALNMMLGPLAALAGDVVPDDHKGRLGGFMAFAPALGALSGAFVTHPGLAADNQRLWLVAGLVIACMLPVLVLRPPQGQDGPAAPGPIEPEPAVKRGRRSRAFRMWLARLAVQIAEASLFSYLLYWLLSLDSGFTENQTARLFSAIMLVSVPLALAVGHWSDRANRPLAPLQVCALIAASGLVAMALATTVTAALAGYALFGLASAVFLALHSAQTLRILPRPDRRARDLGLFNLANTVPSLIMPWLVLGLVPLFGYPALFALLALLSAGAALLLRNLAREG
jgi:MFS family permease